MDSKSREISKWKCDGWSIQPSERWKTFTYMEKKYTSKVKYQTFWLLITFLHCEPWHCWLLLTHAPLKNWTDNCWRKTWLSLLQHQWKVLNGSSTTTRVTSKGISFLPWQENSKCKWSSGLTSGWSINQEWLQQTLQEVWSDHSTGYMICMGFTPSTILWLMHCMSLYSTLFKKS